ncbi:single-stranded DNA-binding protein [Campylobacter coli]|nr:single-stranded DNA-binding protein [Campylobacter coli]
MNQAQFLGYLGSDFETGQTRDGKTYAKANLAISERWKNQNGDEVTHTDWIPLVIFGKKAEIASQYFFKGSQFLCTGKINTTTFIKEDNTKGYSWQVIVSSFSFLGKKDQNKQGVKEAEIVYEQQSEIPKEQGDINAIKEQTSPALKIDDEAIPF